MHLLYLMICSAVISFFILGIIVNNCIVEKKFKYREFSIASVNLFAWILGCIFCNKFIAPNEVFSYVVFILTIVLYLLFGIMLYVSFVTSMLKNNHYHMLIETIKSTRFNIYIILDKKDKIKEISSGMLVELGLDYEETIGKKFFDIFDKTTRILKFNGVDMNNKELKDYYKSYRYNTTEGKEEKREIILTNYKNEKIVLNVVERPVYVFSKYRGRMWIGEKKSDEVLLKAEKELNEKRDELEGIRYKFIGALELTHELMFFIDITERYIWFNDNYKNELGLKGNTLGMDDFRKLMTNDDAFNYNKKIAELTHNKPFYDVKYRLLKNDKYIWVNERGKRLFDDKNSSIIIGFVDIVKSNEYEKLGIPEVDNCLTDKELKEDVEYLYKNKRTFELLAIRINNLPEINEKYGRSIGNMVLGEYIKKILYNIKTESSNIYRVTGIDFILTVTDPRKMQVLDKAFKVEAYPLNMKYNYGSEEIEVKATSGIAESYNDAEDSTTLISCAKRALKVASTPGFSKSCCYYKDVR